MAVVVVLVVVVVVVTLASETLQPSPSPKKEPGPLVLPILQSWYTHVVTSWSTSTGVVCELVTAEAAELGQAQPSVIHL